MNQISSNEFKLKLSLLLLRIGVFIVFFMWAIDKLINPEHAVSVFSRYYFFDGLSINMAYIIGVIQLIFVLSFLFGIKKKITYGTVFLMHLASTLFSYQKYLEPWTPPNLLFYAAFPMLAAIAALCLLRDEDTLFTIK
jgi:putative oxidoreductase